MNCPLCEGALRQHHARLRDAPGAAEFALQRCEVCGHGITHPAPADAAAHYAPDYHGARHGFTARHCFRRRLAHILSLFGAADADLPRALLDIGCGDGSLPALAQQRGLRVAGTELACEAARARGLDVRPALADFSAERFGVITLWHSLEHMSDPVATLREARALLHPGGFVLIAVPDARCLAARLFGRHWLHLDVPRHLHHFSRSSLILALESAGFTPLCQFGGEEEYDLMGWSQSLLDALGLPRQEFLRTLTGKSRRGALLRFTHLTAGALSTTLMLVPWAFTVLIRRPGTLCVAARTD